LLPFVGVTRADFAPIRSVQGGQGSLRRLSLLGLRGQQRVPLMMRDAGRVSSRLDPFARHFVID
jgi:hypothetical protein